MERERKVDLNKVSEEQYVEIEKFIRSKMKQIVENTTKNMNKYLNIYGLEVVLGVQIVKQGEANLIKEGLNNKIKDTL